MKKSALKSAYQKARKRLTQFIRRAKKRGYEFPENTIPDRPKRITAGSIRRLEKLTPERLYKKAVFVDQSTGEVTTGTQGRKLENTYRAERSANTKKARQNREFTKQYLRNKKTNRTTAVENAPVADDYETYSDVIDVEPTSSAPRFSDIIINNFYQQIAPYSGKGTYAMIASWIDDLISSYGKEDVAEMLQAGASAGYVITPKIMYSDTACMEYISGMINYLPEAGAMTRAEIMENLSQYDTFDVQEMGEILG